MKTEADQEERWLCTATDIHALKQKNAELETRTSIQADMLNISVDCIKLIALDGTLVHMNKAGCRALGVPEDSPFGMPWLPLLPQDVWEAGAKALTSARAGSFARFPGRSVLPDQDPQFWDNMLSPILDANGQPTAILCVSREVTSERQAVEALKKSEERLAIAARVGGLGIWDYDIRRDELRCDETWHRIMGRPPEQPIRSIAELRPLIHPEDVARATEVERTAAELIAEERDYAIVFRVIRPNGEIRWVRSAACIMQDASGAAVRAVGFVLDVTDARIAEEKLRESRDVLRQAEKLARTGNWTWDIEQDHAVWSEMLYEIFGLDPTQPAPRLNELREIFAPESFEAFLAVAEACVTKGVSYSIDLKGVRRDGAHRFVHARGEPVRDASGRIVQVRGTIADITKRKDTENRMRALSERIQLAVEAGGVGIWEHDVASQQFLWDEQMHALYGLKPGDFGCTLDDWKRRMHPDDAGKCLASWTQALADGSPFDAEFRIVRPEGDVRYHRAQARIIRSPEGVPLRAIGTNWDITPAREAEEKLRAERHLLRTLVDHLPEVVFITDREDRIQLVNPVLRAALNMPPEPELIGQKLHSFLPVGTRERLWDESREVMESGVPRLNHVQHILLTGGGEEWVRTSKIPRRDAEGRVIGMICFSTNITPEYSANKKIQEQASLLAEANAGLQAALSEAERHAQRALASERAKAEFLAVMSHEIRTPMNSVLGMLRPALQTPLSPKQQNYLNKIDLSARSLVAIINDVLDFSKIEAGRMSLESAEFSLTPLLESVSAVTSIRAEEKGLGLAFEVAPDVPDRIVGDSLRLGQILINLVNNAVKFTERGEVVVSVRPEHFEAKGTAVLHFAVRDTGIGLTAAQIDRLFRVFSQADADVSRKYGGTGLGLSICKSLVELMGGTIHVESVPGAGSTFSFSLPVEVPSSASRVPPDTSPLVPAAIPNTADLAGRRVLVVDDNALNREVAGDFLSAAGIQTEFAASGHEALTQLECAEFDAVLMDVQMPDMDGRETTLAIRQQPRFSRLPIIALTAQTQDTDRVLCFAAGMNAHLTKPIDETQLYQAIRQCLSLKAAPLPVVDGPVASAPDAPRSLIGVDLQEAFNRLGCSHKNVRRALRGFVRDFHAAPAQLERDLAEGNLNALGFLGHTVKSAAACIGARDLAGAASRVEQAVKEKRTAEIPGFAAAFRRELDIVLESIAASIPDSVNTAARRENAIDFARIDALLARAAPLVRNGGFDAAALLEEIRDLLVGTTFAAQAGALYDLFEDIELEAAGRILEKLRADLTEFRRAQPPR